MLLCIWPFFRQNHRQSRILIYNLDDQSLTQTCKNNAEDMNMRYETGLISTGGLILRARFLFTAALAVLSFCGVLGSGISPAKADDVDELRSEVAQLKEQVRALQGGTGPGAAAQEIRWQELDRRFSELTGQIERVEIKVNDLASQLERMQKDVEFRLGALEGNAGGASPAASAGTANQSNATATGGLPPPPTALPQENGGEDAAPVGGKTQPGQAPQPGVLGTLTPEQAANLPQPPTGAAETATEEAGSAQAAASSAPSQPESSEGGTVAPISLPGETPREKYNFAIELLKQQNYDKAAAALKTFVMQYPDDDLAGNAQYWLGETYYVRGDFRNAAVAFAEGYQKYPQNSKAPDNLLKLAMALGQQGQTQNACLALNQLNKKFPNAADTIKDRASRARERYSCK